MGLFDDDIAVTEKRPAVFEGTVSGNWSVNGNPNGGYLMAIMAGAMTAHSDKKSFPIVSANYISRCVPGKVEVRVEDISNSTQFNRYEARLMQDGREKVRSLWTFTVEKTESSFEHYETGAPRIEPLASCVPVAGSQLYSMFLNLDMRLDPASAVWMQGKTAERSEQKGWVRFRDGRGYDPMSLLLVTDSIPPAIFVTHGPAAWVPTIELQISIRNMPQTEWLAFSLRTRFVTCGLLEADCEVWDDAGNLASISRQIAQIRRI